MSRAGSTVREFLMSSHPSSIEKNSTELEQLVFDMKKRLLTSSKSVSEEVLNGPLRGVRGSNTLMILDDVGASRTPCSLLEKALTPVWSKLSIDILRTLGFRSGSSISLCLACYSLNERGAAARWSSGMIPQPPFRSRSCLHPIPLGLQILSSPLCISGIQRGTNE